MTLHYEFPIINHLNDVSPHIRNDPAFIVAKRDFGTVINYVQAGKDTFPEITDIGSAIRRECRGLIFGKDDKIMSRRFHKFFNLGERSDVMTIDINQPHDVLEKLDGSMITPIKTDNGIRWASKMGLTDVAAQAERFINDPNTLGRYDELAEDCLYSGQTPIFEWVSRQQRIVIDYPKDNLILTAIRDNRTGKYTSYEHLAYYQAYYYVPVVKCINSVIDDIDSFVEELRKRQDIEGVVIRFENGHMVKIKADTYVALHRAKSLLDNERDVVGLVVEEKTDDLMPLLSENDKQELSRFTNEVWRDIFAFQTRINLLLRTCEQRNVSRKDFALNSNDIDHMSRSFVFACWDTKICNLDRIVDTIKDHLSNNARYEKVKQILRTAKWKQVDNEKE